jgi:hypothetical protein
VDFPFEIENCLCSVVHLEVSISSGKIPTLPYFGGCILLHGGEKAGKKQQGAFAIGHF